MYQGSVGITMCSVDIYACVMHRTQEMRKQVEALRGTLVFTAQERPEGVGKGFREDLFKKWASGDGIFGRMPYAVVTRVVNLLGWKRTAHAISVICEAVILAAIIVCTSITSR